VPTPDTRPYREANRANWDDRTRIHLGSRFYDVEGWLRDRPGPRPREVEALGDVSGLRLLHLQCHFGMDTLGWARAGARVVGLDFSPAAVAAARELAARAGLAPVSEFVCLDVYDAVERLGRAGFDIVYVSLGALCWLPSVDRWAEQVGQLLAPGGRFYLHDTHPVAWALADQRPEFQHTYFEQEQPLVTDSDLTYTDLGHGIAHGRSYEWNHGIGETVTALIRHGLQLEWLVEHDWTVWPQFAWLISAGDGVWSAPVPGPRPPLTFSLLARRGSVPR